MAFNQQYNDFDRMSLIKIGVANTKGTLFMILLKKRGNHQHMVSVN